ncbi:MAG TPA: hypothetical protein VN634_07235 [Candidatus Limnocylindrales bacterium]|nr:hypothetical protein [Candidatus Limnocylindrales bacterium]
MEFEDATIIGTIAMTNTGGRSGVIERILVVVQPNLPATSSGSEERGDRYALLPREEIAIDTTLNEWSTIGPPLPVTISGNTTLVHHYRFRDKAHGALRWVEQRYRLTLLAKIPGEKMYKLLDEAVIDIGDVVQLSPVHDAYRVIPVRVLPLDPDGLVTESGKISEGHVLEALFTRGAREASAAH